MGCNDRVRISTLLPNIRVAQLDRATAYEAVGWGLESLHGYHFKEINMKPIMFENPRTRERVVCDDLRNIAVIEGEEYLAVRRENERRVFLIRRAALVRVKSRS